MRTIGSQQGRDRKGAIRKQLVIGTSGNQVVAPSGVLWRYQELGYLDI